MAAMGLWRPPSNPEVPGGTSAVVVVQRVHVLFGLFSRPPEDGEVDC